MPYPIMLVIGGSILGFVPGIPDVRLDPDLVLLIILPPLLLSAAYEAPAREMRRDARSIVTSAVLLVLATTLIVAATLHAVVDGFSWAAALTFGAIVSPTDPLAATAIIKRLGVPRRMATVIEGESLINDGTALVTYRSAVLVALGGSFGVLYTTGQFVFSIAGGVAVGAAIAWMVRLVFRRMRDDILKTIWSLAAAYLAFLPAEALGVSGVIAVVTAGVVIRIGSHEFLGPDQRLRDEAVWEVMVFLLNALLFILVGLQLPGILEAQEQSVWQLAALGLLASAVVVVTRVAWMQAIPNVVLLGRHAGRRGRRVGWRSRLIVGWSGLRGAVSLAAALALPARFPERDLIVFLTLCVIFATLVAQGLSLPWLIRRLGIRDDGSTEREELEARLAATRAAMRRLDEVREEDYARPDSVARMRRMYEFRELLLQEHIESPDQAPDESLRLRSADYRALTADILEAQREELRRRRSDGVTSDEIVRTVERELDLEHQRVVAHENVSDQ